VFRSLHTGLLRVLPGEVKACMVYITSDRYMLVTPDLDACNSQLGH
jgi:hypothetical protein